MPGFGFGRGLWKRRGKSPQSAIQSLLLADGSDGLYFDFAKADRLFQTLVGATSEPADSAGEQIAVAMDQHSWGGKTLAQVLALQPDLVVNGSGSDSTGWTNQFTGSVASVAGEFVLTAAAGNDGFSRALVGLTIGSVYQATAIIRRGSTAGNAGLYVSPNANLNGNVQALINTTTVDALFVGYFTATATTMYIGGRALATGTAMFKNITAKLVPGHHGLQVTTAARPAFQVPGVSRYDATDDTLLTDCLANAVLSGVELVVNGNFATNTLASWTNTSTGTGSASGAAGVAALTRVDGSNKGSLLQALVIPGLSASKTYRVSGNVTGFGNCALAGSISGTGGGNQTAGAFSYYVTNLSGPVTLFLDCWADGATTFDNLSVQEVVDQKNSVVAKVTVPASLAGFQSVGGAHNTGSMRFALNIAPDGTMQVAVGSNTGWTPFATDLRGQTAVLGFSFDGTTVRAFLNGAEATMAQVGGPPVTVPFRVGARNADGTAQLFFGGDVSKLIVGRKALTLAQFIAIKNELMALP